MPTKKLKVAFLDRDGVINKEVNYLYRIKDFSFTYKCVDAMHLLLKKGYSIVIITNQAGIAKGLFDENAYHKLTAHYLADLSANGVKILDVKYCPHHPEGIVLGYNKKCNCRKPAPGMIIDIVNKYEVCLDSSIMVGDKVSDVLAGEAAGIKNNYLVRSGHTIPDEANDIWPIYNDLFELSSFV